MLEGSLWWRLGFPPPPALGCGVVPMLPRAWDWSLQTASNRAKRSFRKPEVLHHKGCICLLVHCSLELTHLSSSGLKDVSGRQSTSQAVWNPSRLKVEGPTETGLLRLAGRTGAVYCSFAGGIPYLKSCLPLGCTPFNLASRPLTAPLPGMCTCSQDRVSHRTDKNKIWSAQA